MNMSVKLIGVRHHGVPRQQGHKNERGVICDWNMHVMLQTSGMQGNP